MFKVLSYIFPHPDTQSNVVFRDAIWNRRDLSYQIFTYKHILRRFQLNNI